MKTQRNLLVPKLNLGKTKFLSSLLCGVLLFSSVLAQDGTLDPTFGIGGKVTTDFLGNIDFGSAIAIQSNGKIVVFGTANDGSNNDFALARYLSNGTLDATFGSATATAK